MCYHQNGIVQKYELVKTEDLPHIPESQFSPQLLRDIAHNILSFLKSKATKEGHTYWLFKGNWNILRPFLSRSFSLILSIFNHKKWAKYVYILGHFILL